MRTVAALLMTIAVIAPMSPERADAATEVGSVSDLVIDTAHQLVFTSGYSDRGEGIVRVSGLDATTIATLSVDSPRAMTLSADGAAVLVAQGDTGSITSIDTSTLDVSTVALGDSDCPIDIAVVEGEVWIVSRCFSTPELKVVDLATGVATPVSTDLEFANREARLLASPQLSGSAFVIDYDDFGQVITALDVAVTPPAGAAAATAYSATIRAQKSFPTGPAVDSALSPDGSQLAVVRGHIVIERFNTDDLSLVGSRTLAAYDAAGVALRDDGWRVEAYNKNEEGLAQLIRPDGTVARTWELQKGSSLQNSFGRVGFAGEEVMALQYRAFSWTLHHLPLLQDSTLALTSKHEVDYRKPFVLHVRRTGTSASTVTITATPADKPAREIGHVQLDQQGRGQLEVTANRTTRFTASVDGDSTHLPASDSVRVKVRGAVQFRIDGDYRVVDGVVRLPARTTATLVAKIPHSQVGSCAYFLIQYKPAGAWRALAGSDCLELPESRIVKTKFRTRDFPIAKGHPLRLRGEWFGDAWFAGSASSWTRAQFG